MNVVTAVYVHKRTMIERYHNFIVIPLGTLKGMFELAVHTMNSLPMASEFHYAPRTFALR